MKIFTADQINNEIEEYSRRGWQVYKSDEYIVIYHPNPNFITYVYTRIANNFSQKMCKKISNKIKKLFNIPEKIAKYIAICSEPCEESFAIEFTAPVNSSNEELFRIANEEVSVYGAKCIYIDRKQ